MVVLTVPLFSSNQMGSNQMGSNQMSETMSKSAPSLRISNTDNKPFLLPIDIGQYGRYRNDEIEIRICNDFIEISGQQDWRMVDGGANKRMFAQRHVLPDYIDLNAIFCKLLDSKTILVSAPSVPFVSKLTSTKNVKVDVVIGLDSRGLQFVKKYNSTSPSHRATISKTENSRKMKNDQEMPKCVSNLLFGMVKKQSKSTSNPYSNLFTTEQGQKNINFVNNIKSQSMNQKIHLNVDQLMKDKSDSMNVTSIIQQHLDDKRESSQSAKKSKRRRSRKKKSKDQSMTASGILNDAKADDPIEKFKIDESPEKTTKDESETVSKSNVKKKSSPRTKKAALSTSTASAKQEDLKFDLDEKIDDKLEDSQSDKKKDDWPFIKKDDLIEKREEVVTSTDELAKSETTKNETKSNKTSIKGSISNFVSNFLTGGSSSLIASDTSSSTESSLNEQPLVSCLKSTKESTADKSNDSKKEKHVVIALEEKPE